jgi:hypothetical protein
MGVFRPFSYCGGRFRLKAVSEEPQSGFRRLLHVPSIVLGTDSIKQLPLSNGFRKQHKYIFTNVQMEKSRKLHKQKNDIHTHVQMERPKTTKTKE